MHREIESASPYNRNVPPKRTLSAKHSLARKPTHHCKEAPSAPDSAPDSATEAEKNTATEKTLTTQSG